MLGPFRLKEYKAGSFVLLERNPNPTVMQIKEAFTTSGPSAHLCRCGSYAAIIDAVKHAAAIMAKGR